jgi:hypothetical protein
VGLGLEVGAHSGLRRWWSNRAKRTTLLVSDSLAEQRRCASAERGTRITLSESGGGALRLAKSAAGVAVLDWLPTVAMSADADRAGIAYKERPAGAQMSTASGVTQSWRAQRFGVRRVVVRRGRGGDPANSCRFAAGGRQLYTQMRRERRT